MEDFVGGLVVVFFLLCAGFTMVHTVTPENVTPELFQRAVTVCEPNGGLKVLEMDVFYHDAECNNGAVFQLYHLSGA